MKNLNKDDIRRKNENVSWDIITFILKYLFDIKLLIFYYVMPSLDVFFYSDVSVSWRFIIVSVGLAALLITAVTVNTWSRTKGQFNIEEFEWFLSLIWNRKNVLSHFRSENTDGSNHSK